MISSVFQPLVLHILCFDHHESCRSHPFDYWAHIDQEKKGWIFLNYDFYNSLIPGVRCLNMNQQKSYKISKLDNKEVRDWLPKVSGKTGSFSFRSFDIDLTQTELSFRYKQEADYSWQFIVMSYGPEEGQVEITSTHVDDMFAGTLLWVQEHIVEV